MEKNIYTEFFELIKTIFSWILNSVLFIVFIIFQFGMWVIGLFISIIILKWILSLVGINFGISF